MVERPGPAAARRLRRREQWPLKMAQNVSGRTIALLRRQEFGRIRSALAASSHFQALQAADLDRLAQLGRLQRLRHAERAARADAQDDHLWIVLSGAVRVSTQTP